MKYEHDTSEDDVKETEGMNTPPSQIPPLKMEWVPTYDVLLHISEDVLNN